MSPLPPITTIFMFESPVSPIAGAQKRLLTLLGRKQCRYTLFFHQEHDELRRFAVARVAADDVNVIRAFIESFAGFERDGLGASQLHHDRTLEHVHKGVRIVSMDFVGAARRVGDRKDEASLPGMSVKGLDMISFTSGGGAAGTNCAASAQAAIAIGRMIFFMATPSCLAQICFSFKA